MRNGEVFPSLEVVPQHIHCETPIIPRSSKQGGYKIGIIISIAKGRLIASYTDVELHTYCKNRRKLFCCRKAVSRAICSFWKDGKK